MTMIDESIIRQRAYELWERDARPDGAEGHYWRLAREQLEKEGQQAEGGEKADEDDWPAKGEAARYSGA
ncbi:DUF2934 domain-containing protein [Pseudomonas sp. MPC6]|jgi:hypothetical protein|nr:DUF2934 domain-containing protein [Pseudomonas sp. MPC6]